MDEETVDTTTSLWEDLSNQEKVIAIVLGATLVGATAVKINNIWKNVTSRAVDVIVVIVEADTP